MRKIERTAEPDCLRKHAAEWTERYVSGMQENPGFKFRWYNSKTCYHGKDGIRARLRMMTQQRCAFCDGPVGVESKETVEHFRPKRHFPQLAYDWSNLFPACDVCQEKGDKFDEALLKPDEDGYEFNRYFIKNYDTGEIEVNTFASPDEQNRAEVTLTLYRLNTSLRKRSRKRESRHFQNRDTGETLNDFNYRFFLQDQEPQ